MFDDSFYIIFTWAPEYFTWAQAWVCPGKGGCIIYANKHEHDQDHFISDSLATVVCMCMFVCVVCVHI